MPSRTHFPVGMPISKASRPAPGSASITRSATRVPGSELAPSTAVTDGWSSVKFVPFQSIRLTRIPATSKVAKRGGRTGKEQHEGQRIPVGSEHGATSCRKARGDQVGDENDDHWASVVPTVDVRRR